MKTYTKLILSLLVLVLIVAALPTSALAATDNTTVSHAISVFKQLDGDTPPSTESFSFELKAVDGAPMPSSSTVTISGEGTASFGAVEYTDPKDYIYTVSEVAGSAANYSYDKTIFTVTVQVTTDDAGTLTAKQYVETTEGKPADGKITFKNTYTEPQKPTSGTTSPKTNDVTNDQLLAKIIAVSGAAMLVLVLCWNRRKKQAGCNENKE